MSTASCRVVGPHLTAPAGSLAAPASSCRCASSRGCSAGCSCRSWRAPSGPASCSSSPISPSLPNRRPSHVACANSGASTGWSTPSHRSEAPNRCWPISAATPTASPSANSRLLSLADGKIRFTWKDYRADGMTKVMTLDADEFIRRFLLHALPDGFHRIRHYGFLANGSRGDSLALCRRLLDARVTSAIHEPADNPTRGDRPLTAADFAICP